METPSLPSSAPGGTTSTPFQRTALTVTFYVRLFVIVLWSSIVFILGTPLFLAFWGNLNLNRMVGRVLWYPLSWILGLKIEISNEQRLTASQPCVYLANHQSALEVLLFASFVTDRTLVIGKKQILWVPFFGLFFAAAGNIFINRQKRHQAVSGLTKAVEIAKNRGASILIFPEGTRNKTPGTLLPFKKGPFHMAISGQLPIVPIVIAPIQDIWDAAARVSRSGLVRVQVLDPIPTRGLSGADIEMLSDRVRSEMLACLTRQEHRP